MIPAVLASRLFGDRGEASSGAPWPARSADHPRGYRTSQGEIDLIARDGPTLVFVEVKTRRGGQPAEAVTPEKQRRITLTALHFLKRHRPARMPLPVRRRGYSLAGWSPAPEIQHYRHAFEAVGRGQMYR